MANYISYDLRTYFEYKPSHVEHFLKCSGSLTVRSIGKSVLARRIEESEGQYFSHEATLYICSACGWWCFRELMDIYFDPQYSQVDEYLVVGKDELKFSTTENGPATNEYDLKQSEPWLAALEDPNLYHEILSLPEEIGALFIGGKKKTSSK